MELLAQNFWRFAEGGDFAYWWSCIGKGLRLQPGQQVCFGKCWVIVGGVCCVEGPHMEGPHMAACQGNESSAGYLVWY